MVKKVIDIISLKTQAERASKQSERSVAGKNVVFPERQRGAASQGDKTFLPKSGILDSGVSSFSHKKLIFILLVLILIGIFSYVYFVLPKAEIKIWPKTEFLATRTELIIGKEIPGEVLESTKRIEQQFVSSDRFLREARAEGIIRLYNNYSTASQALILRTRFMSACGKTFRTPVRVVIPGKRREAGRWVPGTTDIRAIADQPGDEFNIGPTAFSIPGLAGLARFAAIYGRSYKPMTGGEIRDVVQVGQKDLNLAKDILTEKAVDACLADLKIGRDNQGISILEEAVEMNILESSADVEVGAEVEEFTFQVKAKCRTIGFKKDDIKKFGLDFLGNQIPKEKLIVPESLEIDCSLENIDIAQGEMGISLDLTVALYLDIDQFALQKKLVGKSLIEAQAYLKNMPQINRADVDFWPFWVESVPKNLDRIKILIRFD